MAKRVENIDQAIELIRSKGEYVHIVYFGGRKFYQLSNCKVANMKNRPNVRGPSWKYSQWHAEDGKWWTNYTGASLVAYAKSRYGGNHWNPSVKEFRHKNNRAKTKELIQSDDFDSFSPKKLAKDENIWNWD